MARVDNLQELVRKREGFFFSFKGGKDGREGEDLDTKKQKSNKIGALMQPMPPR